MHYIAMALVVAAVIVVAGVASGIIHALATYYRVRTMNFLNKKLGGKSFILLSGAPVAVKQAFDVCVSVLRVAEAETAAKTAKVGIANDQPTEPAGPAKTEVSQ